MPRLLSMSDARRSRSVCYPLGARGASASADPYTCYMVASKFTLCWALVPGTRTWYRTLPPEPPLYRVLVLHLIYSTYCSTIVACMVCTLGGSDAWWSSRDIAYRLHSNLGSGLFAARNVNVRHRCRESKKLHLRQGMISTRTLHTYPCVGAELGR